IFGALIGAIAGFLFSVITQASSGPIDWGRAVAEAGIGAATGALAGATMGASIFAGNVIARGVTSAAPRIAQCAAKGAGLGMKALGAFSSGGISSAAGDVLRGDPVDWDKARWSGAFTLGMFAVGGAITPAISKTSLVKPLLSERWQFPNSKWNGYLFDERPRDLLGRSIGAPPVSEGFHTNPSIFSIGFDFARAFGNKAFLWGMGFR
ncbi:MAG: hypothetical protein FJY85_18030, partial [Deltaproteobacteria bacterium]|nr:hypothetical protein [Deltaproteobacteria bacterium]